MLCPCSAHLCNSAIRTIRPQFNPNLCYYDLLTQSKSKISFTPLYCFVQMDFRPSEKKKTLQQKIHSMSPIALCARCFNLLSHAAHTYIHFIIEISLLRKKNPACKTRRCQLIHFREMRRRNRAPSTYMFCNGVLYGWWWRIGDGERETAETGCRLKQSRIFRSRRLGSCINIRFFSASH